MNANRLSKHPIHLGLGATIDVEPEFTGSMDWYEAYAKRHEKDGVEGRLVSMHTFSAPWDMWEMHPHGDELVLCVAGEIVMHQEQPDGKVNSVKLAAGEYALNAPGVWHTADVEGEATALFITAGWGTQHRPR